MARSSSPWFTAGSPVEISGRDVASARVVAPNRTPEKPSCEDAASPERSRTMPAKRVARAATTKIVAALVVLMFFGGSGGDVRCDAV
jgi:hypothetical protein